MYTKYYGLKEKPFEITTDPRFLYLSENHKEALAHLIYAVNEKKGFTVITGEVGTGKTTLIQSLLGRLNGNTKTAFLFNPGLETQDFFSHICTDLGLKVGKESKGEYLRQLQEFLLVCYSQKQNVILIIDEAQNLDPKLLEEVRLLTNLETPKRKLLQVILVGQPELDEILSRTQFRQLKQRISTRYHIHPLNRPETKEYIRKRLLIAGGKKISIFSPPALREIYHFSKGIPRLINIVCDNALLTGYASEQKVITRKIIREVVRELEMIPFWKAHARLLILLGSLFLTLLIGGLFFERDLMQTYQRLLKEAIHLINFWINRG